MTQNIGVVYASLYKRILSAYALWSVAMEEVARTEQEEIGGEDWERSFYFDHEKNPLEKVITRIFDRLVHTASRRFGVGGRPLQLPDDELRDEFVAKDHVDHFDPAALWGALVARYQGENGERTAFVQAAREIAREFRAEHGTKLAQVSGRVALSCDMYGDTCRFTKRYDLSVSSIMGLQKLVMALCVFAAWADDADLQHGLGRFVHSHCHYAVPLVPRAKIMVSETLHIVTFQKRFEFRFMPMTVEQLQLFLAEFGTADKAVPQVGQVGSS